MANQVKALISKNLYDNSFSWEILNQMNDIYKKAVALIDSEQYASLLAAPKKTKEEKKEEKQKAKIEKKKKK
jgi:hypothetical protein